MAGSADFGLIGLAVMGQNLIMNVGDHGFKVCVFNRTVSKVDRFLANEAQGLLPLLSFPSSLVSWTCSLGYNRLMLSVQGMSTLSVLIQWRNSS